MISRGRLSIQNLGTYADQLPPDQQEQTELDEHKVKQQPHLKNKVSQNELSNDASNETSDSENNSLLYAKSLSANPKPDMKREPSTSRVFQARDSGSAVTTKSQHEDETADTPPLKTMKILSPEPAKPASLSKKFFCKVCDQGFTRKHNMVSHEMIHTTFKVHTCPHCKLSFRRIHDLKRHEKLHTGEKPFHCEHCDRSFTRPDALTRHLNSPHACSGLSEKKPEDKQQNATDKAQQPEPDTRKTSQSQHSQSIEADQPRQRGQNPSTISKKERRGSIPPPGKNFNDEKLLPLALESSSASVFPTSKSASDPDSGTSSSSVERSTKRQHSALARHGMYPTGEQVDPMTNRPTYDMNQWPPQQLNAMNGLHAKRPSPCNTVPTTVSSLLSASKPQSFYKHRSKDFPKDGSVFYPPEQQQYPYPFMSHQSAYNPNFPARMGNRDQPQGEMRSEGSGSAMEESRSHEMNHEYMEQRYPAAFMGLHHGQFSQPPYVRSPSIPLTSQGNMQLKAGPMQPLFPISGHDGWGGSMGNSFSVRGSSGDATPQTWHSSQGPDGLDKRPQFVSMQRYEELENYSSSLQLRLSDLETRMVSLEDRAQKSDHRRDIRSRDKM